jgi:two-component system invasion response regulator UvrY
MDRMTTNTIRVLVVDDQPRFRRLATALLAAHGGFDVVGEADSGEDGVTIARQLQPQLVVMDVRLPGINGPEATRHILSDLPATVVVLVSTSPAADLPAEISSCGAAGFLQKEHLTGEALVSLCAPPR